MAPIDISKFEQLKASGDLPSPKGVALAIIEASLREDASMAELAHLVKSDPAFVARLIRASNGVNALGRRPVVAVQDALVVLGLPAVRTLALGFSLVSNYARGACECFDYTRYWSHSLAFAIAMQAITTHTRAAMPEETFSVGLLARIGELALATLYPRQYSEVIAQARAQPQTALAELEQRAFAMNHRELAAAMMSDWRLPKAYVDPVFFHEHVGQAPFAEDSRAATLARSLELARHLATICLAEPARRGFMLARLFRLGSRLSFEAEAMTALCERVVREWTDWGRLLDIATDDVPPFAALRVAGEQAVLAPEPAARVRVLVVDDDPALRAMLCSTLEENGNEVIEAHDGRQGLELALQMQPDMLIVDWIMPGMDGMELVQALRQTRVGRGMFVMVLTAHEDDERMVLAFERGADDFMAKPISPRMLAARLRAGERFIDMQREIAHDREEIRHFASELSVSNRRLQEMALTDTLTGLPNRRYAMDRMQQEWAAATRSQRPVACMVIDVDEFKLINDNFGHDVGDSVLRQAAALVKGSLRGQDVVCRTGGDEFLVICPDSALESALACAERVRCAIETASVQVGSTSRTLRLSIGVAARAPGMRDPDELIKVADQGVYRAKGLGRNQVATVQAGS